MPHLMPHPTLRLIGRRLRILREKRGLTQLQVAERVERDEATVRRWEKGSHPMDVLDFVRLANLLDVSLDYLGCKVDLASELRVRDEEPLPFIDWEAVDLIRSASSRKDLKSLHVEGFIYGHEIPAHWEIVSRREFDARSDECDALIDKLPEEPR